MNNVYETKISYIPFFFDKAKLQWIRLSGQKYKSPEEASEAATKAYLETKRNSDLFCIVKETAQLETVESFSLGVNKSPLTELPTVPEEPEPDSAGLLKMLIQQNYKDEFKKYAQAKHTP